MLHCHCERDEPAEGIRMSTLSIHRCTRRLAMAKPYPCPSNQRQVGAHTVNPRHLRPEGPFSSFDLLVDSDPAGPGDPG
jgi:hypothetical protein